MSMSVLHSLAPTAATPVSVSVAAGGPAVGSGRLVPTVAAVVGLSSVIIGGWALARSGRIGTVNRRAWAVVALVAGLISGVVGGLHMANSAGGPGTGNGVAGAAVAVVVGLVGMVIGGLAVARSRRSAQLSS
jgi:hypothetical protein